MAEFTKQEGRDVGDVKMYALSTCGWCAKTRNFLDDHDVAYSYVYMDLLPDDEVDEMSDEQREYNPSGSFPTIVVNGSDVIIGYDLGALEELAGE